MSPLGIVRKARKRARIMVEARGSEAGAETCRTRGLRRSPSALGPGLGAMRNEPSAGRSGCEVWAAPAIDALPQSTERAALSPAALPLPPHLGRDGVVRGAHALDEELRVGGGCPG